MSLRDGQSGRLGSPGRGGTTRDVGNATVREGHRAVRPRHGASAGKRIRMQLNRRGAATRSHAADQESVRPESRRSGHGDTTQNHAVSPPSKESGAPSCPCGGRVP